MRDHVLLALEHADRAYHVGMAERQLVQVELRFVSDEDPDRLGERIKESVSLIVGGNGLEDFRVRTLPLTERPKPRAVD